MLIRAVCLLSKLKALVASTKMAASVVSFSKMVFMACTAASQPASCPAHNWAYPATFLTSSLMTATIALLMIHHEVSPIAIGRTPGHLSMTMNLKAMKLAIPSGSTNVVHIFLAINAMLLHKSVE